jgi:hypothetical protein
MSSLLETIAASPEAKEPQAQPEGQYKVSIATIKPAVGRTSHKERLDVWLKVEDPVNNPASLVRFMLFQADDSDGEDRKERILLDWKSFLTAFGITVEAMQACVQNEDFESLKGLQSWALLGEEESEDFGIQNKVKRFISAA